MPQAVVLGGLVTDLMSYAPRFPVAGETLVAHGFNIGFGGKGANTAYMCVQLGIDTALLAKLGDDQQGENYLRYLKTAGMDTTHVSIKENCKTAASVITVVDSGENTIVYYPGAADELSVHDVERAEELFRGAKVFASVFETRLCNVSKGVEIAKKHGLVTYVNAAPIVPDPFPLDSLPLIDYLCLNEVEGSSLVCKLRGIPTEKLEEQEIVDYLLQQGGNTVILTRGPKGAAFASKTKPELTYVPVDEIEDVVDTTGAGDAFNGGFIFQLVVNSDLSTEDKVRKACGIASLSVKIKGTQSSYRPKSDIPEKFL